MEYPGLWTEHGLDLNPLPALGSSSPHSVGGLVGIHSHMMWRAACRDRVGPTSPSHRPSRRRWVLPRALRGPFTAQGGLGSRAFHLGACRLHPGGYTERMTLPS